MICFPIGIWLCLCVLLDLGLNASNLAPLLVTLFALAPHINMLFLCLSMDVWPWCSDGWVDIILIIIIVIIIIIIIILILPHYFDHVSREFLLLAMLLNNKPPLRSGPSALAAPRVVRHVSRHVSTARLPCVAVAWAAQRWCFGRLQRKLSTGG